jgi:hypothetical protein
MYISNLYIMVSKVINREKIVYQFLLVALTCSKLHHAQQVYRPVFMTESEFSPSLKYGMYNLVHWKLHVPWTCLQNYESIMSLLFRNASSSATSLIYLDFPISLLWGGGVLLI